MWKNYTAKCNGVVWRERRTAEDSMLYATRAYLVSNCSTCSPQSLLFRLQALSFYSLRRRPRSCKVWCFDVLLFDCLDALPPTAQPLFPQADAVVAGADSQYIAAQTPADAPGDSIDVENGGLPITCISLAKILIKKCSIRTEVRGCPDAHSLVL
jgi:hypothetical protein